MLLFYHTLIGFREPLKSVTCSLVTAWDYLVITWIYFKYLDLGVWSSVVCMGSRTKAFGKLRSVSDLCTTESLQPPSAQMADSTFVFVPQTKSFKASPIFCSPFRVKWGLCHFSVARKCYTTHFWATLTLIAWQDINFIQVIQNFNSMLLHSYCSLNKTVNIPKCLC